MLLLMVTWSRDMRMTFSGNMQHQLGQSPALDVLGLQPAVCTPAAGAAAPHTRLHEPPTHWAITVKHSCHRLNTTLPFHSTLPATKSINSCAYAKPSVMQE